MKSYWLLNQVCMYVRLCINSSVHYGRKASVSLLQTHLCLLALTELYADNVDLYEDEDVLLECTTETSKRYFPSADSLLFSKSITNLISNPSFPTVTYNWIKRQFYQKIGRNGCIIDKEVEYLHFDTQNREQQIRIMSHILLELQNFSKALYNRENVLDFENRILKNLNRICRWSIVISPYKDSLSDVTSELFGGFILVTRFENEDSFAVLRDLSYQVDVLDRSGLLNRLVPTLVVVTGDAGTRDLAYDVLHYFSDNQILNVTLLIRDNVSEAVNLFTWSPYQSPSGQCGRLKEVVLFDSWIPSPNGGRFLQNSKFHSNTQININGCYIEIFGYEQPPFLIFEDNEEGEDISMKGLFVEMLRYVAKQMNMSLISDSDESKEFYVEADVHVRRVLPFFQYKTATFYTLTYAWYVPLAETYPRWASMSRVFSTTTWLIGFLSILVASFVLRLTAAISRVEEPPKYQSVVQCLTYAWSALLGIGVGEMPRSLSLRSVFLSWIIYCLCVNTVFQMYVTSYLVDPGFQHQVDSFEELEESQYELLFNTYDTLLLYLEKRRMPIKFLRRSIDSMLFLMQTPKVAMFSDADLLNYDYGRLCGGTATYVFYKFREEQLQIHVSMVLSNNYILNRINEIIHHLVQAGIPDKIMRDLTDPMGQRKVTRMVVDLAEEYSSLSLSHFVSPFALLLLGHGLSLSVFMCESAYHWIQDRRAK